MFPRRAENILTMRHLRAIHFLCAFCALQLCPVRTSASEKAMDIVLAIDTSGSMQKTDPHGLRAEAARLFVELLGPEDGVALVAFDTTSRVLADLGQAGGNRSLLKDRLSHIPSDGKFTNLHEAIRSSRKILEASARESRAVILMTDGKMDLGDARRDRELELRLLEDHLPSLRAEGIRVFAIAFTELSDVRFLKQIAFLTEGFFYLTEKDDDLHVTFAEIYEHMVAPDALPIREKQFYVDRSVRNLDIVVTKENAETGVGLEMPDRRVLTLEKHPRNVRWHQARAFEMISVSGPLVGTWHIHYGAERGNRVFVLTDLKLMNSFRAGLLAPDTEVMLEVWLQEGTATAEPAPVAIQDVRMTAEIVPKGGEGIFVRLNDAGRHGDGRAGDGVYTAMIRPPGRGEFLLNLQARGLTFEREQNVAFYVPEEELEEALAQAEKTAAAPASRPPAPTAPPGEPEPDAPVEVGPPPVPERQGVTWGSVLVRFLAINAVLGLCLAVFFLWRRRNDRKAGEDRP